MEYIKSINATNLGHFINSYIRHLLLTYRYLQGGPKVFIP